MAASALSCTNISVDVAGDADAESSDMSTSSDHLSKAREHPCHNDSPCCVSAKFPSATTATAVRHGKTVAFCDDVKVVETKHVRDMTPEERADRWFTRDDFLMIKLDVLDHVRVGRHFGWESSSHAERTFVNANGDVAVVTMRGIRSEASSRQRRFDQQETTRAVLNEQMLQRSEGGATHLPEVIAMLYNLMSHSGQQRALEVGTKDALCVYGTEGDYQRMELTKNVLCESMPMDSDMLCVEESFAEELAQRWLCDSNTNSIEDWLFERYERGQQLADLRLSIVGKATKRNKPCKTDHVPGLGNGGEDALLRTF